MVTSWIAVYPRSTSLSSFEAFTAIEYGGAAKVKVTFAPELRPTIDDPITTLGIRISIDADSDIIESDENNNLVDTNLDVMKLPKAEKDDDYERSELKNLTVLFMLILILAILFILLYVVVKLPPIKVPKGNAIINYLITIYIGSLLIFIGMLMILQTGEVQYLVHQKD